MSSVPWSSPVVDAGYSIRRVRALVIVLYTATAALVTAQRGILGPRHSTFEIFRASFWHLLRGLNLYASYPLEQGAAPANLFKYSPTAAVFFAPFALPPYSVALFAWSLLGALMIYRALQSVLEPRPAVIAALLVYPDLLSSLQACSSNAVVGALIILAFAAMERGRQWRAALAVVGGAAIKLFPLAALSFAVFHPRRRRFALVFIAVAAAALALPLLVSSPARLVQQYRWWDAIERSDAADLAFGLSAMRLLRDWIGGTWPNWPMQVAATVLLLLPVAIDRQRWTDPDFRLHFLASLLCYAVLFNHQAEHASYVIASAGVAIWCVVPASSARQRAVRLALGLPALAGLGALPLSIAWTGMQTELFRWSGDVPSRHGSPM